MKKRNVMTTAHKIKANTPLPFNACLRRAHLAVNPTVKVCNKQGDTATTKLYQASQSDIIKTIKAHIPTASRATSNGQAGDLFRFYDVMDKAGAKIGWVKIN